MSINTEKFLEDARKLTEQRMAAAENIAQAISARVAAEEALKEAEAKERKAYKEAERNGWTKTELNKLKPVKKRRPAQKKNTSQEADNAAPSSPEGTATSASDSAGSAHEESTGQSRVIGNG